MTNLTALYGDFNVVFLSYQEQQCGNAKIVSKLHLNYQFLHYACDAILSLATGDKHEVGGLAKRVRFHRTSHYLPHLLS